jgi:hypothetical protein
MTELSTANSFVVRVYRIDPEDPNKITGLVEAMDGNGERTPFTSSDELVAQLNLGAKEGGGRKRRKKHDSEL